jgi:hypothetical protein
MYSRLEKLISYFLAQADVGAIIMSNKRQAQSSGESIFSATSGRLAGQPVHFSHYNTSTCL